MLSKSQSGKIAPFENLFADIKEGPRMGKWDSDECRLGASKKNRV